MFTNKAILKNIRPYIIKICISAISLHLIKGGGVSRSFMKQVKWHKILGARANFDQNDSKKEFFKYY